MRHVAYIAVSVLLVSSLLANWREEIMLFFNNEGYRPSSSQFAVATICSAAVVCSTVFLALNFDAVKRDYAVYKTNLRKVQTPPEPALDAPSPKDSTAQSLVARGFSYHSPLGTNAEIWLSDKQHRDGNLLLRKSGAILYHSGTATHFSVAVLSQDDTWKLNDPILVRRQSAGRPVSIGSAVKRPILRELLASNDYVIAVGLASHDVNERSAENEELSRKRAFNMALALTKLRILPPDRIRGVSLGECSRASANSLDAIRQRSVVFIGANASRDVVVNDVIKASAAIVDLQGLDLSDYSERVVWNPVDPKSTFKTASDLLSSPSTTQAVVLPAVPQRKQSDGSEEKDHQ